MEFDLYRISFVFEHLLRKEQEKTKQNRIQKEITENDEQQ